MSKKTNKVNVSKTNKVEEQDITNDIVYVRVVRNFNDATDNERFISAGPNSYYKTNKERADMLAKAGYVEYDNESTVIDTNINSDDTNNEDNTNANDDVDNSNDITDDNVNEDDNTSDEDNANDDSEDTNVDDDSNANDENNTDNEDIPNE